VGADDESAGPETVAPLAAAFLSGLAQAFGLEATTVTEIDGDELEVRLEGADLGLMIGPRGQTLLAIQDLARTVSQRGIPDHGRLRIDVGGYRERRREALARFTAEVARQVLEGGSPRMLEPMAAADRKVVHDTASTISGVQTRSEGEEPNRRVVILPAE
jgi:spoIIIJ-associated protein